MRHFEDRTVLCGASAYEQKYYFNPEFNSLPEQVKDELHIMCVLFTAEIGGVFTLVYDEDGNLEFETQAMEADGLFDEIGAALKIKKLRYEKQDLLESLELYYRVFFLGEEAPETEDEA